MNRRTRTHNDEYLGNGVERDGRPSLLVHTIAHNRRTSNPKEDRTPKRLDSSETLKDHLSLLAVHYHVLSTVSILGLRSDFTQIHSFIGPSDRHDRGIEG